MLAVDIGLAAMAGMSFTMIFSIVFAVFLQNKVQSFWAAFKYYLHWHTSTVTSTDVQGYFVLSIFVIKLLPHYIASVALLMCATDDTMCSETKTDDASASLTPGIGASDWL